MRSSPSASRAGDIGEAAYRNVSRLDRSVVSRSGWSSKRVHHAGDPEAQRDAVRLDRAQVALGVELLVQVHGAAAQQRGNDVHPRGVGDRRRGQVADVSWELVLGQRREGHGRPSHGGCPSRPWADPSCRRCRRASRCRTRPPRSAAAWHRPARARATRSSASGEGPSENTCFTVAARSRSSAARSAALAVDDQRVDLGVVAHVDVVVERSEWVQRRHPRADEAGRRHDHPRLWSRRRQDGDARPVADAALDEHTADATDHVRGGCVRDGLAVVDEGGPIPLAGQARMMRSEYVIVMDPPARRRQKDPTHRRSMAPRIP